MAARNPSKFRKLLHSKPVIAGLVILIAFIGTLEFQQLRKRSQYNREIAELQRQEQELVAKNKTLQESLEYFNNDEYREKIARQQLNLKKDGEIVVNFPAAQKTGEQQTAEQPKLSNPQKWWNYFFNHDS